jgi:hypothetical protein
MRRYRLDSLVVHDDGRAGHARRLAQKSAFARIRLDQFDAGHPEDSQYQTRKTGAAAEIDQTFSLAGNQRQELRRVEEMAPPQIAERIATDQVYASRPLLEQRSISLEPRQCFT